MRAAAIEGPTATDSYFAAVKEIKRSADSDDQLHRWRVGQSLGGSRAVQARPSPAAAYATPVPYAKQHVHAKKIGISCGQLSAEQDGATIVQNAIKSTGGTLTASEGGSVTGTNITPQVLWLRVPERSSARRTPHRWDSRGTMTYKGLCTTYHADSLGYLIHQELVIQSPDGNALHMLAVYTAPQVSRSASRLDAAVLRR